MISVISRLRPSRGRRASVKTLRKSTTSTIFPLWAKRGGDGVYTSDLFALIKQPETCTTAVWGKEKRPTPFQPRSTLQFFDYLLIYCYSCCYRYSPVTAAACCCRAAIPAVSSSCIAPRHRWRHPMIRRLDKKNVHWKPTETHAIRSCESTITQCIHLRIGRENRK